MSIRILSLIFGLLASQLAGADCVSPPLYSGLSTGKQGQISLSAAPNKLIFCDGTNWRDLGGTPSATACTINGQISMASGEMRYCNGTTLWPFDSGAATNGACSTVGEFHFNTVTSKMEFCNGSDWRVVEEDAEPVPFTFNTFGSTAWEGSVTASVRQFTGITSGVATLTSTGTTCTNFNYRYCADAACASIVSSGTFNSGDTLNVKNGYYMRVSFTGASTAAETCTASVSLGSMTATLSATTAATDTTPNAFAWGMTRNAAASSVITSATVRIAGHSGVTGNVSDIGTGGTPEFRVCSDSGCTSEIVTWGSTSQTVPTGSYVQLRTTTGASPSGRRVSFSAGTGPTVGYWYATTGTCGGTASVAAGASVTCSCGPYIASVPSISVIGTGAYRQSSEPCLAAVHAGVLNDATGGSITYRGVAAGTCASFTGSTANGVTSTSSASSSTGFYFPAAGADPCP